MIRMPTLLAAAAAVLALAAPTMAQEAFIPEGQENFHDSFRASPAIRAGDFIFISGVVGYIRTEEERTPEAYETAIRDTFQRIETLLNTADSSWSDVVEMTTFHVDMREHQEIFRAVREEFVTEEPYPAWTGIGVDALWADPLFVEVRVTAYVGE